MIDNAIPVKTAAGREEITRRQHKLNGRQRVLLIAVDGDHKVSELQQQFSSLGDVQAILRELASNGLISAANDGATQMVAEHVDSTPPVSVARQFMNETVVSQLGLRAFFFTLKIERCYSRKELTDLLPEYVRLLGKTLDFSAVAALQKRAENLISKI